MIVTAARAVKPCEPARQASAGQKVTELLFDKSRQTLPLAQRARLCAKGFNVLDDDLMQDTVRRISRPIATGGRRAPRVRGRPANTARARSRHNGQSDTSPSHAVPARVGARIDRVSFRVPSTMTSSRVTIYDLEHAWPPHLFVAPTRPPRPTCPRHRPSNQPPLTGCSCGRGAAPGRWNFQPSFPFSTVSKACSRLQVPRSRVKGTVYATAGTRRTVVALDGTIGEIEVDVRDERG